MERLGDSKVENIGEVEYFTDEVFEQWEKAESTNSAICITRRNLLKKIGIFGTTLLLTGSKAGCSKQKSRVGAKPKLDKRNIENLKYKLPDIKFKKVEKYEKPKLPKGADPSDLPEITKDLLMDLKEFFEEHKILETEPSLKDTLNSCVNTLIYNDAEAFGRFFAENKPKFYKNPYLFIEYLNKFLLQRNHYLVVDIHSLKFANLYPVKQSSDVIVNGEKLGQLHSFGKGILSDDHKLKTVVNMVHPLKPKVINYWPHQAEHVLSDIKDFDSNVDVNALKKDLLKGFMHNGAISMYLMKKFPSLSFRKKYKVDRNYISVKGLNINIEGEHWLDEIQALCTIGAQLAVAKQPAQMAIFTEHKSKSYQLMRRLLLLIALKHLPGDLNPKKRGIEALKTKEQFLNPLDVRNITKFFLKTKDTKLVNRIGEEMYQIGYEILETLKREGFI